MAIGFCPLEADWGNLAEWAAVVVGAGAAAATVWVAMLAHATSRRATSIAEQSWEMARQQRLDSEAKADDDRARETTVILYYLASEISSISVQLYTLDEITAKGGKYSLSALEQSLERRNEFGNDQIVKFGTTRIVSVIPRLHAVQPEVGLRCARLAGDCAEIFEITREIAFKSEIGDDELAHYHESLRGYVSRARAAALYLMRAAAEAAKQTL